MSLAHHRVVDFTIAVETTAAQPAVRCKGVHLTYGGRRGSVKTLNNISIDIPTGQFLCLVGPSGCGKSSLLGLVAGLREASAGTIEVLGKVVTQPVTELGMVFQKDLLLPWRSAIDNVMLQAEVRSLPREPMQRRAKELLAMVGLIGFEDRYPHELSGGMRQRCAIVRGLVHDPSLLLMDEPFASVDALTRDQLNLDLLALWSDRRPTVIFVTHGIDEAVFLGDRVLVMSDRPGEIVEDIEINLERPRNTDLKDAPEFRRYTKHIRHALETMPKPDGASDHGSRR